MLTEIGEELERSAAHLRGPQGVALTWLAGLMPRVHSLDLSWFLNTPMVDLLVRTESHKREKKNANFINL